MEFHSCYYIISLDCLCFEMNHPCSKWFKLLFLSNLNCFLLYNVVFYSCSSGLKDHPMWSWSLLPYYALNVHTEFTLILYAFRVVVWCIPVQGHPLPAGRGGGCISQYTSCSRCGEVSKRNSYLYIGICHGYIIINSYVSFPLHLCYQKHRDKQYIS